MSNYKAKTPDASGHVSYTDEENETWQILMERQIKVVEHRACKEFIAGLQKLALPHNKVPQCYEVTQKLQEATGWSVKPVSALISLKEFFNLLANKQFPAATFIRTREELDYLKEPDIFHEFFGHCPLLTNPAYADFVEWYGKLALQTNEKAQSLLGRIFWFTIEFGLVRSSNEQLRIYGGGILSSLEETVYALESNEPQREAFDIGKVLETPYRYDIIQNRYFVLNSLDDLYKIQQLDIVGLANAAANSNQQGNDFNIC
ncbi:MAG: phenylalanine 4-monooxygenase [Gammaproteobacteria bacterium]|nr:phenylalanine 4-monooxygenase [Gammaproteobacteria bacterium]